MNIIERFYDSGAAYEWQRLERHRTEYEVTLLAMDEYLPAPPGWIADIGGGPGRYSIELSRRGYQVVLADLSQAQLDFARQKALEARASLAAEVHTNALDLRGLPLHPYQAVLLMGPLYHLLEERERAQAVRRALDFLQPGGLLFASFITRYAVFRDAALKNPLYPIKTPAEAERIFTTGMYDQVSGAGFTQAYFVHPDEVSPMMEAQGLESLALLGVEGIVAENEAAINSLEGDAWQAWVRWNYRFARDPALRAAADHLLYIGKKKVYHGS